MRDYGQREKIPLNQEEYTGYSKRDLEYYAKKHGRSVAYNRAIRTDKECEEARDLAVALLYLHTIPRIITRMRSFSNLENILSHVQCSDFTLVIWNHVQALCRIDDERERIRADEIHLMEIERYERERHGTFGDEADPPYFIDYCEDHFMEWCKGFAYYGFAYYTYASRNGASVRGPGAKFVRGATSAD